jgi:hypothetical protein
MPKGVTYNQTQYDQAEAIADALKALGVPVTLPSAQLTPNFSNTSTSGTVAVGKSAVSFYNSGAAAGILLGASLPAGASVNFTAPAGQTLSSITYDATGTTFLIGSL